MRQRLQLEAEKGWLRTYILYAANLPCAFWMGTVYRGKFYSDCLGYDPSYEKYSPGTFLLNAMIEDSCRDGIEQVDFGLGDARYKQRFGNCSWQEVTAYIYGPSWRGLRVNALRTPAAFLDRLTKQALDRTNLLPKIKKLWRNRLRQL
jgi:CelD/BcsL family acetyltransferase involved in cellulose biosynthesis